MKTYYGVGINDADYVQQVFENVGRLPNGKIKQKLVWKCPFYARWALVLCRCYSAKFHKAHPTYADCSVCDDWVYFSKFKSWMEQQDWEGKQLDKDILFSGNRIYSPETCLFVTQQVNSFVMERKSERGAWPIGVCYDKNAKKFISKGKLNGKPKHLGLYNTPEEAHQAWLTFKLEQAYILAAEQTDERVAKALISRYENYSQI
jgi:hypothetical protein